MLDCVIEERRLKTFAWRQFSVGKLGCYNFRAVFVNCKVRFRYSPSHSENKNNRDDTLGQENNNKKQQKVISRKLIDDSDQVQSVSPAKYQLSKCFVID